MSRSAFAAAAFLLAATLVVAGTLAGRKVRVGRNVFVNPPGIIDAYSTPTIVENPRRPENVVTVFRMDAPRLSAALASSTDGGQTWSTAALPLPAGTDRPFFPDAAFAPDGTLYVTYDNLAGTGNVPANLFLSRSSDGGRTLSAPSVIASGLTFQPRIAIGADGVLHVTWLQVARNGAGTLANASEQIVAVQSKDAGSSWSSPVAVSAPGDHLVGSATPVAAGGGVAVAFEDFGPRPPGLGNGGTAQPTQPFDVLVARLRGDGGAFSTPSVIASAVRSNERFSYFFPSFPGVAAGPHDSVYVAWATGRDVVLRRSADGGTTWQPPAAVRHAASGSGNLPAVSVAPTGRVDVVYIDQAGGSPGLFTDIHLATSADQGRTFRDVRLSSESFNSAIGPAFGGGLPTDLGSHLGLAAGSATDVAAWGDTRLGTETTGREDIVAASVKGLGSGLTAAWWYGGAAVLAAAGIAALAWRRLRPGPAGAAAREEPAGQEIGATS